MEVKSYWEVYMDFSIVFIPVDSMQCIVVLRFEITVVHFSAHEVAAYDGLVIDYVSFVQMAFLLGELDFNVSPRYFMLEAFDYCSLGILCVKPVGAQVLLILPSKTRKGLVFTVVDCSHNVHPSGSILRRPSTELMYDIYSTVSVEPNFEKIPGRDIDGF